MMPSERVKQLADKGEKDLPRPSRHTAKKPVPDSMKPEIVESTSMEGLSLCVSMRAYGSAFDAVGALLFLVAKYLLALVHASSLRRHRIPDLIASVSIIIS